MSSTGHAHYVHAATALRTSPDRARPGGPEAWVIWILATIFVVWLFAIQTGYGIVSPSIQADAGLSVLQISLAASVYTWTFALVQFFSGSLLDRYGTRPLMAIAVALVTGGAFLYSATTTMVTLVLAQVVMAVGASFGFVGAGYIGGKWFAAAKYGLMFGLVQMFSSAGSAVSQPLISALLGQVSWHQLLAGFGAFGALLTVLFILLVRNPARLPAAEPVGHGNLAREILTDLGACFSNRQVLVSAIFAGVSFGTMLAVGVLWGPRLMEARGASAGFAAVLTSMAWLGLAVGAPLANLVSERFHSRKRVVIGGLLLQALAVALLVFLPDQSNALAAVIMFSVGLFAGTHMLGFSISGESVVPALIGSAAAIVNGFCFIAGGILMAVPGYLLSDSPAASDYHGALAIMPIALVVAAGVALALTSHTIDVTDPGPAAGSTDETAGHNLPTAPVAH